MVWDKTGSSCWSWEPSPMEDRFRVGEKGSPASWQTLGSLAGLEWLPRVGVSSLRPQSTPHPRVYYPQSCLLNSWGLSTHWNVSRDHAVSPDCSILPCPEKQPSAVDTLNKWALLFQYNFSWTLKFEFNTIFICCKILIFWYFSTFEKRNNPSWLLCRTKT